MTAISYEQLRAISVLFDMLFGMDVIDHEQWHKATEFKWQLRQNYKNTINSKDDIIG
jgi:hypothetical protein